MAKHRPDRVSRKLEEDGQAHAVDPPKLLPSPEVSTNIIIADIVLRSASRLFRHNLTSKIAASSVAADGSEDGAADALDGRTLLTSLGLYGASKLATRSPAGLGIVIGGLALKTLYDRGKARQKRLASHQSPPEE